MSIYSLNKEDNKQEFREEKIKREKVVYTILGFQDELLNGQPILIDKIENNKVLAAEKQDIAYAMYEKISGRDFYSIRLDQTNSLFNPNNIMPNNSRIFNLINAQQGPQFTKVNKQCFESYLEFLKTKNPVYYKFAERHR